MAELVQSQNQSSNVVQQASSSNSSAAFFSSSSSSSFSASSSSSTSSSSSSATKVVKQSVTSIKQSSSSSTMTSSSSSSSKMVSIQSSGQSYSDRLAVDLGIADVSKEMERLQLRLGDEMTNIHRDIFRLMPSSPEVQTAAIDGATTTTTTTSGTGGLEQFLVKMDSDAIKSCIDKAHDDRVKLNFDVNEFDSETINIRTVGNKIEVHAMKKSKKGDEERSEEFSRVYELPNELDPSHVTSSIYNDGVLTIELPVIDALGPAQ